MASSRSAVSSAAAAGSKNGAVKCRHANKECSFLCGKCSNDADECEDGQPLKWAYPPYPDGSVQGDNDWYCDRVYKSQFSHLHGRKEMKRKLATDKSFHDAFLAARSHFVAQRKDGSKCIRAGAAKQRLEHVQAQEDKLMKPADDFYPLERYLDQFGDPRKNRKRGHTVTVVQGVKGVLVPGDDGKQPWKLQRSYNSSVVKTDTVDSGESVDSDGQVDNKYDDLVKDRDAAHQASSTGMIAALFNQVAEEYSKPPAASFAKGATAPTTPVKCAASSSPDSVARRRRRILRCNSSDPPEPRSTKRGKGQSSVKKAAHATRAAVPEAAPPGRGSEGGDAARKGRPPKDIVKASQELVSSFSIADENSIFYGDRQGVQLRSLSRLIAGISAKASNSKEFEIMRKQLQTVETCMKLHRGWSICKAPHAANEFIAKWNSMQAFLRTPPEVSEAFCGRFMQQVRLEALVTARMTDDDTPLQLTRSALQATFGFDTAAADDMQTALVHQGLAMLFSSSCEAGAATLSKVALRFAGIAESEFVGDLHHDMAALHIITKGGIGCDSSDIHAFRQAMKRFEEAAPGSNRVPALLASFKPLHQSIMEKASDVLRKATSMQKTRNDIDAMVVELQGIKDSWMDAKPLLTKARGFLTAASEESTALAAELGLQKALAAGAHAMLNLCVASWVAVQVELCETCSLSTKSQPECLAGGGDVFCTLAEVLSDEDDMHSAAQFCMRWTAMWPQLHNLCSGKEDDVNNDVSTESLRAVQQLGDFEALAKMHLAADTKQALDRLSEWHKSSAMPILHEYANTHLKEHFEEFARCFQAIKQGQDWDSHDDIALQAIVAVPVAEKHAQLQAAPLAATRAKADGVRRWMEAMQALVSLKRAWTSNQDLTEGTIKILEAAFHARTSFQHHVLAQTSEAIEAVLPGIDEGPKLDALLEEPSMMK